MIEVIEEPIEESLRASLVEEVLVNDLSPSRLESKSDDLLSEEGDWEVPASKLKKIRLLLRHKEAINLPISEEKKKHKFCKSHQKLIKKGLREKREKAQALQKEDEASFDPPQFAGKNEYRYYVGADDCIKNEV